jgi:peptidoglycan hydrolase CwlO-like protein
MTKTSIGIVCGLAASVVVPLGCLVLNRVDTAIGHLGSANQQLITANTHLETTNVQLINMQRQLKQTIQQLLATNARLDETQAQLAQTNTKLKVVDGVFEKFSFLRR